MTRIKRIIEPSRSRSIHDSLRRIRMHVVLQSSVLMVCHGYNNQTHTHTHTHTERSCHNRRNASSLSMCSLLHHHQHHTISQVDSIATIRKHQSNDRHTTTLTASTKTKGNQHHTHKHTHTHTHIGDALGRFVATGSADTSIKLLDVERMKIYGQIKTPPAGAAPATPSEDGGVSHPVTRTFYDNTKPINDLDFHPTADVLVSCSRDCSIKFYDFKDTLKRAFRFLPVCTVHTLCLIASTTPTHIDCPICYSPINSMFAQSASILLEIIFWQEPSTV
jgi:WD40 repeat protein